MKSMTYKLKWKLKVLQDNYLTENSDSNENEDICALEQKVKSLEKEVFEKWRT